MRWLNGITNAMDLSCEQTLGDNEGQGNLACCSSWGYTELDMSEQQNCDPNGSILCNVHRMLEQILKTRMKCRTPPKIHTLPSYYQHYLISHLFLPRNETQKVCGVLGRTASVENEKPLLIQKKEGERERGRKKRNEGAGKEGKIVKKSNWYSLSIWIPSYLKVLLFSFLIRIICMIFT